MAGKPNPDPAGWLILLSADCLMALHRVRNALARLPPSARRRPDRWQQGNLEDDYVDATVDTSSWTQVLLSTSADRHPPAYRTRTSLQVGPPYKSVAAPAL
ncbi:hypothetical protein Kpho02_67800 [Kitasatospora phosalacinea]|uniref:Uncharacterized protein n=1 Tax=Kitasatospora phosalacinea TaxID=2065 RepID=A0A9W6QCW4_9ACTN|nr:hypothetical protein Kpho02_67800 [Kitasatospora phosalacinea]